MISPSKLRVFESVASLGGYTRAAEHLDMSQPAVSSVIRQLEASLQVSLFEAEDRRRLTEAGHELLAHARIILSQIRAAETAMTFHRGGEATDTGRSPRGLLHLAVVSPAQYYTPRLLKAFHDLFPDVRLKLTLATRADIVQMLEERRIDIAITGYPPSEADLEATTFARHPHLVVASPHHPLAKRSAVYWDHLRDDDFVFRERGSATRAFLEQLLQSKNIQVRLALELASNEAVKQAVMSGLGLSFLSAHVCQTELAAGLLVALDLEEMPKYIDWCFIHRRDTLLTGVNLAFKQFVLERGREYAACAQLTPATARPGS